MKSQPQIFCLLYLETFWYAYRACYFDIQNYILLATGTVGNFATNPDFVFNGSVSGKH